MTLFFVERKNRSNQIDFSFFSWVKFEEDVESGGRWSKPHVATLSLHSLLELRNFISKGSVILDLAADQLPIIVGSFGKKTLFFSSIERFSSSFRLNSRRYDRKRRFGTRKTFCRSKFSSVETRSSSSLTEEEKEESVFFYSKRFVFSARKRFSSTFTFTRKSKTVAFYSFFSWIFSKSFTKRRHCSQCRSNRQHNNEHNCSD